MPGKQISKRAASELSLIAALRARAQPTGALRTGIGDDCAILRVPRGCEIAVTTDLLLETTHFRRDWHSPESAGHRCLARGLSDLAAMGAAPLGAFLSIAVPRHLAGRWVARFLDGLLALAERCHVPLAGGDTAAAPGDAHALFSADITLLGSLPRGRALLRGGAHPGDLLYVTGQLGGAAAELVQMAAAPRRFLRLRTATAPHPQLFPEPRLTQGLRLRGLATAAIDVSDGLSTELHHLCAESHVAVELDTTTIPVDPLAAAMGSTRGLDMALHGGEDYELLFTAKPSARIPRSIAGVPVTRIGRIVPAKAAAAPVTLVLPGGERRPLARGGWEHFRSSARTGRGAGPKVGTA